MKWLMTLLTLTTLVLAEWVPGTTFDLCDLTTGKVTTLEIVDITPASTNTYVITVYNYDTDTFSIMEVPDGTNEEP